MKLSEIADRLNCILEGQADIEITGVAGIEDAIASDLTFLANSRYYAKALRTQAGAVVVDRETQIKGTNLLRSDNPYLAFAKAVEIFRLPSPRVPGIHPTAVIAPGVRIGRNPSIGPYVVIEEGAVIGDDCVLKSSVAVYAGARIGHRFLAHSHSAVRENVEIGDDVILQNGAVIGGDGFGFAREGDGSYYKISMAGRVVVEDQVEVQANSCIDRATVGETRIRRGVKIDNLVQVGHGCDIGENTLLCGQAGLAGSCKVGREAVLAGQAGAAGHLAIGDRAVVTAQSGVGNDVEAGKIVSGSPAIDHARWLKCAAIYSKLPEIASALRKVRNYLGIG